MVLSMSSAATGAPTLSLSVALSDTVRGTGAVKLNTGASFTASTVMVTVAVFEGRPPWSLTW